mmetsp:Transcript_24572/g.74905  ORF Transcript_24572/g.74905 Transcript_24572/m.74905 type:complete len:197 (+) Transcript_24572:1269-1859(+)
MISRTLSQKLSEARTSAALMNNAPRARLSSTESDASTAGLEDAQQLVDNSKTLSTGTLKRPDLDLELVAGGFGVPPARGMETVASTPVASGGIAAVPNRTPSKLPEGSEAIVTSPPDALSATSGTSPNVAHPSAVAIVPPTTDVRAEDLEKEIERLTRQLALSRQQMADLTALVCALIALFGLGLVRLFTTSSGFD